MNVFSSLGIDVHLLIAQIINFLILLWLLGKFLYKPIMNRINADEKKLQEAEAKTKELEHAQQAFARTRAKELARAYANAKQMIQEAEEIASSVRARARQEAQKEMMNARARAEETTKELKAIANIKAQQEVIEETEERVARQLARALSMEAIKTLQKTFFQKLLQAIENLSAVEVESGSNAMAELECAVLLNITSKKRLEDYLSARVSLKVRVKQSKNTKLLSGFRLRFRGVLIEYNLRHELAYATNQ